MLKVNIYSLKFKSIENKLDIIDEIELLVMVQAKSIQEALFDARNIAKNNNWKLLGCYQTYLNVNKKGTYGKN